jgi:hypothetical protein
MVIMVLTIVAVFDDTENDLFLDRKVLNLLAMYYIKARIVEFSHILIKYKILKEVYSTEQTKYSIVYL